MLGKVTVILDGQYGSSGKGKLSTFLADHYNFTCVSSANFPNAGHTAVVGARKFIAKSLPTAMILNHQRPMEAFITPGSGFSWDQLAKEWFEAGQPSVVIHERACVVTPDHMARERSGAESTAHIASTMQGTAAALADKIQRKPGVSLAGLSDLATIVEGLFHGNETLEEEFLYKVEIVSAEDFRDIIHFGILDRPTAQNNLLHEGSQGYALSIDHGSHYPQCTSRNCTTTAALDYLGVAPQRLGDVWLNLRTYPIRVGNIAEGSSGDFYSDSEELTWAEVAARAGMPPEEVAILTERERTTVTKRVRRVSTFSFDNLVDAVRTNGATKLCVNFAQYISYSDAGVTDFNKLSHKTLEFIREIEDTVNLPVCLVGTGAEHEQMCVREEYM